MFMALGVVCAKAVRVREADVPLAVSSPPQTYACPCRRLSVPITGSNG
jgi:hypothetical protein